MQGRRYLKGRDLFDLWYLEAILQAPLELGGEGYTAIRRRVQKVLQGAAQAAGLL